MLDTEIVDYIQLRYHPLGIIVYGSFADGSNNDHSDFDALVITETGEISHDSSIIHNTVLDAFIYPVSYFGEKVNWGDYGQIYDGIIVKDTDGIAKYVIRQVEVPHRWRNPWLIRGALAACLALAIISAIIVQMPTQALLPIRQSSVMGIASETPSGLRKFLNYGGCQYVFIENGSPFELTEAHLSESLGRLEYDILADRETNSRRDYAATFAVGGIIYRMTNYDPAFRIAVEFEGNYYICEKAGNTDGTGLDVAALFDAADFKNTVTEIILYDHFGQSELGRLSGRDAKDLIELLAQVSPASLSNEDYEAIGKAQKAGKSFLVVFQLADTTRCKLYLTPSMSIAMIGNDRYTLPVEFHPAFDSVFDALKQTPVERIS